MSTMELQNELIRMILNVQDEKLLEKLKKMIGYGAKAEAVAGTVSEEAEPYMTKAEIETHIAQSCKEVKLMREGKLKGIPAEELLNEL